MKWFSIASICALAVLGTACEKHPASELPPMHGAGGKHPEAKSDEQHPAQPAAAHPEAAKPEPAKTEGEAKPGEAPKFFPENK